MYLALEKKILSPLQLSKVIFFLIKSNVISARVKPNHLCYNDHVLFLIFKARTIICVVLV